MYHYDDPYALGFLGYSEVEAQEIMGNAQRVGLGDFVETVLNKVGVKKPSNCGCAKRKAILNRVRLWRRK